MARLLAPFSVVLRAGTLIWRHWPALLVIFLVGAGARELSITLAVVASEVGGLLGYAVLTLAPLSMLSAIILMFRVLYQPPPAEPEPSREALTEREALAERVSRRVRWRRELASRAALVGASLIPFLAVYQSQGFLAEDRFRFTNEAAFHELHWGDQWLGGEFDRFRTEMPHETSLGLVILVVALALRQLMSRLKLPARSTAWSYVAAYLEVAWVLAVVDLLTRFTAQAEGWVESRNLSVAFATWWTDVIALTGPLAPTIQAIWDGTWALVGNVGALVIVPMAWLTVGAIVLRRTIARPDVAPPRFVRAAPAWLRPVLSRLWKDLRQRFGGVLDGLRTIAGGGLVPMLIAFLVLFTVQRLQPLIMLGISELVGPVGRYAAPAVGVYLEMGARAVFLVAMVCLVAAATERLASQQDRPATTEAADSEPAERGPAEPSDETTATTEPPEITPPG